MKAVLVDEAGLPVAFQARYVELGALACVHVINVTHQLKKAHQRIRRQGPERLDSALDACQFEHR